MKDVINSLHSSINRKLNPLSNDLRSSALSSGWPVSTSMSLAVEMKDGKIGVSYPDEIRDEVHSWEYGTETRRPHAVIRRFMNRIDSKLVD